jgi:hypothetical protein
MDNLLQVIFRNAWIFLLLLTFANAASWWSRGKKEIVKHPELEKGYRKLVRNFMLLNNVPWVVMGIGILYGGVPTALHFLSPGNGPFVIAFWVSVIATWVVIAYWVLFRGGAQDLLRYPGLLNSNIRDTRTVKALILLAGLGGAIGLAVMLFVNPGANG